MYKLKSALFWTLYILPLRFWTGYIALLRGSPFAQKLHFGIFGGLILTNVIGILVLDHKYNLPNFWIAGELWILYLKEYIAYLFEIAYATLGVGLLYPFHFLNPIFGLLALVKMPFYPKDSILQMQKPAINPVDQLPLGHIVGEKKPRQVYLSTAMRAEHVLVLGSTGTGKTTTVLEPAIKNDIELGRGLIFMTAKEEPDLLERFYTYAATCNRTKDVRILTLSQSPESNSYNPLAYGNASELRDLCMEAFSWDNPFYRDQAKSALAYIFEAFEDVGRVVTLADLYYVFRHKGCMQTLADLVKDPDIKYNLQSYLEDWRKNFENTRGLQANLHEYVSALMAPRVCATAPDININEVYDNNQIAIFVLNSLKYSETATWLGRMILQNIKFISGKVADKRGQAKFFPVYIDEFHQFIYPKFFSMVAQCRSANFGITLATQSFADLVGRDFDIKTQVVQNTNTKIILRQNDPDSSDFTAKLSGTRYIHRFTEQTDRKVFLGRILTGTGTRGTERIFKMDPDEIRRLPTGRGVMVVRGHSDMVQFSHVPKLEKTIPIEKFERHVCVQKALREPLNVYGLWKERVQAPTASEIMAAKKKDTTAIKSKDEPPLVKATEALDLMPRESAA